MATTILGMVPLFPMPSSSRWRLPSPSASGSPRCWPWWWCLSSTPRSSRCASQRLPPDGLSGLLFPLGEIVEYMPTWVELVRVGPQLRLWVTRACHGGLRVSGGLSECGRIEPVVARSNFPCLKRNVAEPSSSMRRLCLSKLQALRSLLSSLRTSGNFIRSRLNWPADSTK